MENPTIKRSEIRDVTFGKDVTIIEPANLYECKIGDNCFIGPFVEIQKGVEVGSNCKIQSHSFICELVTIGNNCFIGHGVMFINDTMNFSLSALTFDKIESVSPLRWSSKSWNGKSIECFNPSVKIFAPNFCTTTFVK